MTLVENIAYDEMRVALSWAMMASGGAAAPAAIVAVAPKAVGPASSAKVRGSQ